MIPKFRAWDKDAECMIYQKDNGDEYVWQIGTEDIWIEPIHGMTIPKQVLMQSAGLKDKNGVEIFEGDIVLVSVSDGFSYLDNETTIVQQSEFHAGLICKLPVSGVEYRIFKRSETGYEYEVIGNIYENPELLEEVKK